jgi:hypothetical protein
MKNIDTIFNMPPPKNISQLHILQGRIQANRHFVTSLVDRTLSFTHILKKEVEFNWNEDCK